MAKKLKFQKTKAGGADKIREDISRSSGFGNMMWIKNGDSKSVRILAEPKDWEKYSFLRYEELKAKGKLPVYSGWKDDFPDVAAEDPRVRQAHVIPVGVINEESGKADRFMFWEPSNKVLKDLLAHFDRRKTVLDRDWDIVREGEKLDTTYTLIPDDPSKRPEVSKLKELDFDDELVRMVEEFTAAYASFSGEEPEEEDEKPSKSKSKKGKPSKRMEEPEDEEEEEEEPEEEEADGDDESSEEEEGEEEAPDFDEMDIDELKAAAKELGVKVPKGSKSPTYRKLLKAAVEAEEEEEPEEEEEEAEDEGGAESITGTFVVTDIDARAFTASTSDGEEDREVYFDRQQHDLDEIEEGGSYTFTIEQDEDLDWIVMSEVTAAKKAKPAKKGKGKK